MELFAHLCQVGICAITNREIKCPEGIVKGFEWKERLLKELPDFIMFM